MTMSGPANPELVFSLRRVTEGAACAAFSWIGRGDSLDAGRAALDAMRAALAGNKEGEVEEVADVNLLFQTADVGIGREAVWAEETMSPAVLKKIADWVLRQDRP